MKIEKTSFGQIVIDGKKYSNDIYIISENEEFIIQKRKKELSYKVKGHTCFGEKEAEFLLSYKPEIFFIGKGQFGVLPIPSETRRILENSKVKIIEETTPKIISKINSAIKQKQHIVALLHLTC
ncbi:MAG: MTH938/NDUFAF3 family protein [Candidatus Heimdallarchaeum aukensis]|uniref:MTH938/NDUFAF3 family protein n=1 Tax=Candidatus Heimdallarchaeum aukensis TaxID=2876573 RepID=A0A9Y1BKB3_9ARCH|nr:MAG: MTH938/NDUFAF3 family protein [Candidatus Heimdallarchaeum aukensis]